MRVTNVDGLPEAIVRAISSDTYSKGDADYSCSELVNPPRITLLKQRHADEITEDAVDRLWSLIGQLGHLLLERAGADNALMEERLFMEIGERRISGQSDVAQWAYEDGTITDYKFTSVYTAIFKDRLVEWEQAQNIYAELYEHIGFPVKALQICAIYRDWRPGEEKQKGAEYPPRAQTIKLRLWPQDERQHFIRNRLQVLMMNEDQPDDKLPSCSEREMWAKPPSFAVMKIGNKKASRVVESAAAAKQWIADTGQDKRKYTVVERPGERVRCESYCTVAPWCNVYQDYKAAKEAL